MTTYTFIRKAKWFRNIGPGTPGDYVQAYYAGTDVHNPLVKDPKAGAPDGGIPGTTYTVRLLTGSGKLLAPCPDFCNGGEASKLNDEDIRIIIDSRKDH